MTASEYKAFADELAVAAKVDKGLHGYFLQHRDRLWQTASHFEIWKLRGQAVLEIGPFFSYTPFVLRQQGNDVQVIEGDDPAVYPLRELYQARGIGFTLCDLFESFGAPAARQTPLPFPDHRFDVISCWETMEHFNFNTVGFVRDLHRLLKPGGKAYITVPNVAELENRLKLLAGQSTYMPVESFNVYHNYNPHRQFMGFHWREYVLAEIVELFRTQGFTVTSAGHLQSFQSHGQLTNARKIKRGIVRLATTMFPSTGNVCAIVAQKPATA